MSTECKDKQPRVLDAYQLLISINPQSFSSALGHVLRVFDYNIEFADGADYSGKPLPNYLRGVFDSEEDSLQHDRLLFHLWQYDIWLFLHDASQGKLENLYAFLERSPDFPPKQFPPVSIIKAQGPAMRMAIERCYLLAYERNEEKWLHWLGINYDLGVPIEKSKRDEAERKLYQRVLQKGLRPIDPEAMGLMLMPVIEEILEKNPELRPESPIDKKSTLG